VVDVVVAEVVYLLEAFYDVERSEVAQAFRSIVGRSIVVDDADLVLRAVDL
jgi:predicted nucleic-acid-binding protein